MADKDPDVPGELRAAAGEHSTGQQAGEEGFYYQN